MKSKVAEAPPSLSNSNPKHSVSEAPDDRQHMVSLASLPALRYSERKASHMFSEYSAPELQSMFVCLF